MIIQQTDSKHTVELTGKDLEKHLASKHSVEFLIDKQIPNDTKENKYTIEELGEVFNSYEEAVQFCYQEEIIYYYKATEYLLENDSSFKESLELAHDLGYTLENLSSETLATIHYQNYLIGEITEVF